MRRKILINGFSARLGGGKTYIKNLLARLPQGDFELFLFLPDDFEIPNDPRVHKLTTSWPTNNPFSRLLWEKFVLPWELRKHQIDVLFCPGGIVNTGRVGNCKTVTMFRNMLPFDSRILFSSSTWVERVVGILRKRAMLRSMTRADLVIFISSYARQVIESQASIRQAVTIPHGISKQFLVSDQALERPPLSFAGPYILYVSRFEFYKRHLEVVKAYQMLPDEIKAHHKLLLVGGTDLPSGQKVLDYVRQQGLENQVLFMGEYPYAKLPALYKNAALFIFASACENCPNILLEAMGAGVPIVCSNYEPMPEFGQSAVTYMNPDVPQDICQKIQEVFQTALQNSESQANALAAQAAKFNWDSTARKTWDLLLTVH
jgi:glycosyltransferase involved in cell wall biosynthesis